MKIAVVGCGAVGSYYGARLCRDGQDVHFLLRSDYDLVRRGGVSIRSPAGDFQARPHCAKWPEEIGVSDAVLIGLKTTANDQFPKLLPPLVGPRTAVITLQNGLGNEERLARLFPVEQILGGLCFVCLNRVEPGVTRHLDYGMIVLGEYQRHAGPRTHDLAALIRHAGVACKVTEDLERAHWEKLVWNIPFNGLGVAGAAGYLNVERGARNAEPPAHQLSRLQGAPEHPSGAAAATLDPQPPPGPCLPTDQLLADPRWEELVRGLMLEVIGAARALGHDLRDELAQQQIERTRTMGAYKASTLLDFERGFPLELESLFLEPWRQARQAGVSVPGLTALCEVLTALDARGRRQEAVGCLTARNAKIAKP